MEFDGKIFPGFTALQILAEIQNMMTELQCEPEQFPGRIIFEEVNEDFSKVVAGYANDSRTDIGRFLGLDQTRNGAELTRASRIR